MVRTTMARSKIEMPQQSRSSNTAVKQRCRSSAIDRLIFDSWHHKILWFATIGWLPSLRDYR